MPRTKRPREEKDKAGSDRKPDGKAVGQGTAAPKPPPSGVQFVNLYKYTPKKFKAEPITYAEQDKLRISLPSMFLVVGSTGAGKTNWVLNFLEHTRCFTKVTWRTHVQPNARATRPCKNDPS